MKVMIAGASGLIARAVAMMLERRGDQVIRLVRRPARNADEVSWDPAEGRLEVAALNGVGAVVNLAGENIGAGRWTAGRRAALLHSRLMATRTLVTALQAVPEPKPVLLSASATGVYGDRGDEVLADASATGAGFLAGVCRAWEHEAGKAAAVGVRVVVLRFGVVLARDGGALRKMLPAFRMGVGGRLGSGDQWLSWVHLDDVVAVIERALEDPRYTGALNVVAPETVTNREFTRVLGRVLHRPTPFPVPRVVLWLAFGRMADETLLASARVVPARLMALGYRFHLPRLEPALRQAVGPG